MSDLLRDPLSGGGGSFPGGGLLLDGPWGAPDPHAQVYRPDLPAIPPRHGAQPVTLTGQTSPSWFNVEAADRWPVLDPASPYYGQALYRTRKAGKWLLYTPASFAGQAAFSELTAEQAVAFLIREGFPVPSTLAATRAAQEI